MMKVMIQSLKGIIVISLVAFMAACSGKMKIDANVGANLDVKKEVAAEPKQEEPPPPPPEPTIDELLVAAVDDENRPAEDKMRDQYRHPVETLKFFGLKKEMTVLEVSPGQGWYTRILAPVLKDKGQLIVTGNDANAEIAFEEAQAMAAYQAMLEENKAAFGDVKIQVVGDDNVFGEPESVDMVVSFRNNHFWAKSKKQEPKIYAGIFNVLKPGGVFGVVMHRAAPKMKARKALRKGYLPEEYVISKAKSAGFELVEKSEINANPKDTKNYGRGVWSLPPVMAFGEKDKEKYLEIGESDRMTLLFKKPGGEEEDAEPEAEPEGEPEGEPEAKPVDEAADEKIEKSEEKAGAKEDKKDEKAAKKEEKKEESIKDKVAKAADKAEKKIEKSKAKKKVAEVADQVETDVDESVDTVKKKVSKKEKADKKDAEKEK